MLKIVNAVVWWTGAITWSFVFGFLLYIAFESLLAIAASASWHRWAILEARRRRVSWKVLKLPKSFVLMWWELFGHRIGNAKWTTVLCAEWRGIGDWNLGTALKVPGEE